MSDIREHVRQLPGGSTLLLDGICRYAVAGVIFETNWDLGGVLQMQFHDSTLQGDVISRKTRFSAGGVTTELYGDVTRYPYSQKLLTYDYRRKLLQTLPDSQTALAHFAAVLPEQGCPEGEEGLGAMACVQGIVIHK